MFRVERCDITREIDIRGLLENSSVLVNWSGREDTMRKVMQSMLLGLVARAVVSSDGPTIRRTEEEQIREILSEGVNLYRSGRYDAAYTLANAIAALPVLDRAPRCPRRCAKPTACSTSFISPWVIASSEHA